ncbi:TetR family transcriptional regulator [Streptomyces lucensis JCM 4490]|uniref:TetR family transcriptional regulator n=1 Tax=Streptomyces lucensis JCM 4490 TaxID=1306176 RepID=A0A918JB98_9ACTN|nr:ScbR family autoregulator-binding transcription factor [Streptomyces lucensis]GGW69708.1 TetR family transcriptional regulator [Streptomyces lucensis JCM 4490]
MSPTSTARATTGREPKQERAVRTRAQVLDTAAELFATRGYEATSVVDIAEHVGMTKGAVYFHFKNKEAMAIAVVENNYDKWPTFLADVRARDLDPRQTILALLDRTAEAFRTDRTVQAAARLQSERSLINTPLPEPYIGWIDLLADLFAEAADAGQLKEGVPPRAAAQIVVSSFYGMQHISDVLHQRADLMERWQELRDVTLDALLPHD